MYDHHDDDDACACASGRAFPELLRAALREDALNHKPAMCKTDRLFTNNSIVTRL